MFVIITKHTAIGCLLAQACESTNKSSLASECQQLMWQGGVVKMFALIINHSIGYFEPQ